jgi:hypothetical protein
MNKFFLSSALLENWQKISWIEGHWSETAGNQSEVAEPFQSLPGRWSKPGAAQSD